jgi:hypothetical protein
MVLLLTGAVLLVPDVRRLEQRPKTVTVPAGSAGAAPVPAGQDPAPVVDGAAGAPGAS